MAKSNRTKGSATKLQTQKDGRRFAIATLNLLEDQGDAGIAIKEDEDEDGRFVVRTGPQSDVLIRALDTLAKRGTRAAFLGFCCVLTDCLSQRSYTAPQQYAKWERKGMLENFPVAS